MPSGHDSKRVYYLEETIHYKRFEKQVQAENQFSSLINENGKRADGRSTNELRKAFLQIGAVTQAKGSSYIEIGATKVICSCYGPHQIIRREEVQATGRLSCEFKFSSFSQIEHKNDMMNKLETELSTIIIDALSPAVILESFPRAQVDINIHVLEDDGSVLSASIIAASLAIAHAGIEMYGLVVSQSMKHYGDNILLDPTIEEERWCEAGAEIDRSVITLSYLPSQSQISTIHQHGYLPLHLLTKDILTLTECCKKFYPVLHKCLVDQYQLSSDNA